MAVRCVGTTREDHLVLDAECFSLLLRDMHVLSEDGL
jgi:hypothetical protein